MPTSFTDQQRQTAATKFKEIVPTSGDDEAFITDFISAKSIIEEEYNSARSVVRNFRNYIENERVSEFATRARRNSVGLTEKLVEFLLELAGEPVQARVIATLKPVIYVPSPAEPSSRVRINATEEASRDLVLVIRNWSKKWMDQEFPGAWLRDALIQSGFDESKFESIFA